VSSKEVNNMIVLTFKDNGIGIDLERNRDKIFGLYQRFHNYSDSKGLGLYLVKSQVESMGGTISVESEVDKGTTFTIIFKSTL
jgi:signal transduction histidine kinase